MGKGLEKVEVKTYVEENSMGLNNWLDVDKRVGNGEILDLCHQKVGCSVVHIGIC